MRPRPVVFSRPSGTDGSDHPYRMTVDDRYKKVAQKKLHLRKLLLAQTIFHLVKAVEVVLRAMNGEIIPSSTIATCVFGGVAIISGSIGLRRTSSKFLQFFLFAVCATVMLSLIPLLTGQLYFKVFRSFTNPDNFNILVLNGLEVGQEITGVVVQVFECLMTLSLLQHLSRKRT